MFKRLFVVVLFMVLSVTILPVVAKADVYEYENISELADSVASVINKKNTYTFKYKFSMSDLYADLNVNVNWKNRTVSFNGFILRPETVYKKEKFSAVLNLKTKQVKTSSKIYKKGNNILSAIIGSWNFEDGNEYRKSLGHYLVRFFLLNGKDTTIDKSDNKTTISNVIEINDVTYYSTIIINKSKVLKIEAYSGDNVTKVEMK